MVHPAWAGTLSLQRPLQVRWSSSCPRWAFTGQHMDVGGMQAALHSSCQTLTGASFRLQAYRSVRAGLQTGEEQGVREGVRKGDRREGGGEGGEAKMGRAACESLLPGTEWRSGGAAALRRRVLLLSVLLTHRTMGGHRLRLLCCWGLWWLTGVHCEVDVNECDSSPCQNGATCEDFSNSYRCVCPVPEPGHAPWGGRHCDVRLEGCTQHQCQHGAGCIPVLTDAEEHDYSCLCPPGWTGGRCNTSTTFSFNSAGYIYMQLPVSQSRTQREAKDRHRGLHMHVRFRSTLPDMLLYHRGSAERFMALELVGGSLQARVKSGKVLQVVYPRPGERRGVAPGHRHHG
ncbi:hypothetical protein CesoFtcFv8_003092 [Champsocephalus esox]|uniref:EGF-like domain-containing protein n=1 Tax=Champsocephalus esox TaxID=159716 RepID=A0AAN8CVG1_9TELE|nr:hypothetical protein CesoFtcFv8_003092 [Champsocephalus esox]